MIKPRFVDRLFSKLVLISFTRLISLACLSFVIAVLFLIVGPLLWHGLPEIDFNFLFGLPGFAGREGGIGPILRGTVLITFSALLMTFLFGFPVALALSHPFLRKKKWITATRWSLDLLASTPSIVFGLFGNYLFVVTFKMGYSIVTGSLTLTMMLLPLFIRLAELELASFQDQLMPASFAHGLTEYEFVCKILCPVSFSSVCLILLICVSRAFGETAVLLFTSGFSMRNSGRFFESSRTLSVHIFDLALNVPGADSQALKSSALLIVITVLTSIMARLFMRKKYFYET